MTNKDSFTPKEQQARIRKMYDEYYAHIRAENWPEAFVKAFALLENRINSMYRYEREFRHAEGLEPKGNYDRHRPFSKKVRYLVVHGRLRTEEAEEIIECGNVRNHVFHDLVWSSPELDLELCKSTLRLEKKAMNARKRQKRRHKRANSGKE